MGNVFHEDVKSAGEKGYHTEWNKAHKVNAPAEAGDVATKSYVDALLLPPVGAVLAWLKTYANTPALPEGWVECNGQVLSDAESVYDGQTIPDLNGDNRFLRGNATSGGVGGADTHQHESPAGLGVNADSGKFTMNLAFGTGAQQGNVQHWIPANAGFGNIDSHGYKTNSIDHKPIYYNMVWIMRIK